MTNIKSQSKWSAFKTLLLALPFLALLGAVVPGAQADDHRGYHRRHGHYRQHGYDRHRGGERHRHSYYRHGRRYYGYEEDRYYGPRSGVSVHVGL